MLQSRSIDGLGEKQAGEGESKQGLAGIIDLVSIQAATATTTTTTPTPTIDTILPTPSELSTASVAAAIDDSRGRSLDVDKR